MQIFAVAGPIQAITDAIVSFDCFMDNRKLEDVDPYEFDLPPAEQRVYSYQVMIMAGLPIIFCFLAYVAWWFISKVSYQPKR